MAYFPSGGFGNFYRSFNDCNFSLNRKLRHVKPWGRKKLFFCKGRRGGGDAVSTLQSSAMAEILEHTFPSGLRLAFEPMPSVASVALSFLTPAGVARQPEDRQGVAPMLAEMIGRGAGGQSSREHSEALDRLGVHRSTHGGSRHLRIGATLVGDNLSAALPMLLDMALSPNLEAAEFAPALDLCLQEIDALEDEPQERVMNELRRCHFPAPLGRPSVGVRDQLAALTLADVKAFHEAWVVPDGAILAVAGRADWDQLIEEVGGLTSGWIGAADDLAVTEEALRGTHHLDADTAQVQIALAFDAVADTDERAMLQRMAVAVLSGGSSSRLFTEVREKRGLCYSVYASYAGMKDRGALMGYAGTTAPRAQETLDVMLAEFVRLGEGVEQSEFDRARIGMKSRLVMQGESSSARASSIAADLYVHGRPRSLAELAGQVDAVSLDAVNAFLEDQQSGPMTLVTLGPTPLAV